MKYTFLFLFLSTTICSAQDLKVYTEKSKKGFTILANNNEHCPVSVKIDFNLLNMKSSKGNGRIFVIPAKTTNHVITHLTKIKNGKYKYSYKTRYNYGDHHLKIFDKTYQYNLPFTKDNSFKIAQGYNGKSTHSGENALDFKMPIGTKIVAVKDGIVIKVIDTNNKTCFKKECEKYNNLILIYHKDGTFAEYAHIDTNKAIVKVGDTIKSGQTIAASGNIGRSSGPHLHFVAFLQKIGNRRTIKTKFKINDGSKSLFLIEGKTYSKNYD
jgi:murein DD-endopeptidase MepM/ murein hydrolase activator NlpD